MKKHTTFSWFKERARFFYKNKRIHLWMFIPLLLLFFSSFTFLNNPPASSGEVMAPSATLEHVRNGSASAPVDPGNWVFGNLGSSNSHYAESMSIPYRLVMEGISAGTEVVLVMEYDVKHSNKHALDYLTHYDRLEPHILTFGYPAQEIDPTIGISGFSEPADQEFQIPIPPELNSPVPGQPTFSAAAVSASGGAFMSIWNGNISDISYGAPADLSEAQTSQQITVTFTAGPSGGPDQNVILAWGGHIASRNDWGFDAEGNPVSAGGINGSPYHMRLVSWNLGNNLGNQDRSLSADAVIPPPTCDLAGPDLVCEGTEHVYSVATTNSPNPTYTWSLLDNSAGAFVVSGQFTPSIVVNSGSGGEAFRVKVNVSDINGMVDCETFVKVAPDPDCFITGEDTVCPGASNLTYTAPPGGEFYEWSISGNGTIVGSVNDQTVTVNAGAFCGAFNLSLNIVRAQCASSCSFDVEVSDTTPPTITNVGNDASIECPATPVFSDPIASDDCDANPSLTFNDVTTQGDCAQEYSVTRTWTATDVCGNVSTASQTITVKDDTAPVISGVGGDASIECTDSPQFSNPTTDDNCDPAPSLTFNDVTTQGDCEQEYSITRTWTATDACGNVSTASQTITITDNGAPTINGVASDATIECPATPQFSEPTAEDDCDANPSLTFNDVVTSGNCAQEYSVTRTWTAVDDCGNVTTASQTITVIDNGSPTISSVGDDESIECPALPQFSNPTATDGCNGMVNLTFDDVTTQGNCPQEYTVTRTWTAVDDCGNVSTASQTITVTDNTPPSIINLSDNTSFECPSTPQFANPTAEDACDANPDLTFNDVTVPGNCPQEYSVTRTWTAVDDCGNVSTASQTVSIFDATPPSISCSANKSIKCNEAVVWDSPMVLDDCDANPTVTVVSTIENLNDCGNGTLTRTWRATDCAGNFSECSQTITINDCGDLELLKLTDGAIDSSKTWTFQLSEGGFGGTVIATAGTKGDADGILFDDIGSLSISTTYTICELEVPSGWTAIWKIDGDGDGVPETIIAPYNPNQTDDPPEDLGNRCFDIGVGTPYLIPLDCALSLAFEVNNAYPGGEPRTPGYWKNWNTCSSGNQANVAANNGGPAAGWFILNDILNDPGITWNDCNGNPESEWFVIDDCMEAVYILDQRMQTGNHQKMASDPAYTLAMHLLAAQLNFAAGAETCQEILDAAVAAELLLCELGYDGTDSYLGPNDPEYDYAVCLKDCLDAYNNGEFCPNGECNCTAPRIVIEDLDDIDTKHEHGTSSLVKEEGKAEISVYPVPSFNNVTFEFTFSEESARTTLDIFNLMGEQVSRAFDAGVEKGVKNTVLIDGNELKEGTYLYKLYDGKKARYGKLIIL